MSIDSLRTAYETLKDRANEAHVAGVPNEQLISEAAVAWAMMIDEQRQQPLGFDPSALKFEGP